MLCQLTFPANATIADAASIRAEWLTQVEKHMHVQIGCRGVERMTAAVCQLVISLAKGLQAVGGSVRLTEVPDTAREDFLLLGLANYIEESPHHD